MNITFTSLAIIASLSTSVTTPLPGTVIKPAQTNLFSKSELVQIISKEQQANISYEDAKLIALSVTVDDAAFIAKAFDTSKKESNLVVAEKAIADVE